MAIPPPSRPPRRGLDIMFGGDMRTRFDRALLKVCVAAAVSFVFLVQIAVRLQDGTRLKNILSIPITVALLTTVFSFFAVAVKAAGYTAGKTAFNQQLGHVMKKVFLYVIFPGFVAGFLLIVIVAITTNLNS